VEMRRGYKLGKRAVKELSWFQEACESKKGRLVSL
jgi:hypothetical protein